MKNIVLVTDIFGASTWTDEVSGILSEKTECKVITPYSHREDFASEKEAYHAFTQAGGIAAYIDRVKQSLSINQFQQTLFIGFSAGAAALWKVLAELDYELELSHFIGFYPGQIRYYLDVEPQIETSLIFPVSEQHFDLAPVITQLKTKANTHVWQNDLQHGFVNPSSDNFHLQASQEVVGWCKNIGKTFTANAFSQLLIASPLNYQSLN